MPWYELAPSGAGGIKKLVTEGGGNHEQLDYVTAAASADGKVLLAYVPPAAKGSRSISIDMTALSGAARGRWFDPASGGFVEVPENPFPNAGSRRFETPGKN